VESIFFGEFLLEEGEIDEAQLTDVLDYLTDVNLPVGQIAVRSGCLTDAGVKRICEAQRERDLPFGMLAQELGLLNEAQVSQLLHEQSQSHLFLGEALVQRGIVASDRVAEMIDLYKHRLSMEPSARDTLPDELQNHPIVLPLLEALPRTALRLAQLQIRMEPAKYFSGSLPHPHGMYVTIESEPDIRIGLCVTRELLEYLSCTMLALSPDELTESDYDDALGEFVNILAGTAKRELENNGTWLPMSVPESFSSPESGFAFELVTTGGCGAMIVDPG